MPTTNKYTSSEKMEVSRIEDHVVDEEEAFDGSFSSEDSAAHRRNINSLCS